MNLAEFRIIYTQFSRSASITEVCDLYWPVWVDMARRTLRVDGRQPRIGRRKL